MEKENATLKVYKHAQHTRLQKEKEEEFWISSEDLRTEGSSDEEGIHKQRSSRKSKKSRRDDASAYLTEKLKSEKCHDIPHITVHSQSTSQKVFSEFDSVAHCSKFASPELHTRNILDAATYASKMDDERPFGSDGASASVCESDVEALNLESQWRPKRGSLKLPVLVEGQADNGYDHYKVHSFFDEMKVRLNLLKRNINRGYEDNRDCLQENCHNPKSFKNLKKTPKVQATLEIIAQLDNELAETKLAFKSEKAERMKTQEEMCMEIAGSGNFLDKNSETFLRLSNFEIPQRDTGPEDSCREQNKIEDIPDTVKSSSKHNNSILRRNIMLAKEGNMAGCSLTDEEKLKLEEILRDADQSGDHNNDNDDDDDNENTNAIAIFNNSSYNSESEDEEKEEASSRNVNAFVIQDEDQVRMEIIKKELEKLSDEASTTEDDNPSSTARDGTFWSKFILENALKDINAKLEILLNEEIEDKKKFDSLSSSKLPELSQTS